MGDKASAMQTFLIVNARAGPEICLKKGRNDGYARPRVTRKSRPRKNEGKNTHASRETHSIVQIRIFLNFWNYVNNFECFRSIIRKCGKKTALKFCA